MPSDTTELAGFATRFVTTVAVGDPGEAADAGRPLSVVHASITLLRLPDRPVGVTCQHVVQAYRHQRSGSRACVFRIGQLTLDPEERLLAEERFMDLAVIGLDDEEAGALSAGACPVEFFQPESWPLGSAEPGEAIALGGYGGPDRRLAGRLHATHPRHSGAVGSRLTRVIDVGAENIVCQVTEVPGGSEVATVSDVVRVSGVPESSPATAFPSDAIDELGGLSGGPGFVRRGSGFHLAGVVFAVARSGAYLRLRPARFVRRDGTLLPRGSV